MDLKDIADTPPWEWPRDAKQQFLGALRNREADAEDRIIAAELAGDLVVMDDELAEALLKVVADRSEPEQVRARAGIALGPVLEQCDIEEFDQPWSEPPIRKETFDAIQTALHGVVAGETEPKEVRRRAFEGSVRASQDWHPEIIRKAYYGDDEEWKLTAVFAMNYIHGFNKEILESLKSSNPDIHFQAVRAAGERELKEAWPLVEPLLSSRTEKNLLIAAIAATAWIRPDLAPDVLSPFVDSDDEEIADAASEAIAEAGGYADEEAEDEDLDDDDEHNGYIN